MYPKIQEDFRIPVAAYVCPSKDLLKLVNETRNGAYFGLFGKKRRVIQRITKDKVNDRAKGYQREETDAANRQ